MLIDGQYISFGERPIQTLYQFLIGLFHFLLLSSLHILGTSSYQVCSIFSYSVGCLFTFLMGSFEEKVFNFDKAIFFLVFPFIAYGFGVIS